jgi:catalase
MAPGIAPSADPSKPRYRLLVWTSLTPVLQARMFAYPDAQRYRLGANYQQLPANRPVSEVYSPYQRDGAMNTTKNYGNDPNYVGASTKSVNFKGVVGANGHSVDVGKHDEWVWGKVESYASEMVDEDYEQARSMWKLLGRAQEQEVFIGNVAAHLGSASKDVQKGAIGTCGSMRDYRLS